MWGCGMWGCGMWGCGRDLQQPGDDLRPRPRGDGAEGVAVTGDDAHVLLGDVEVVGLG